MSRVDIIYEWLASDPSPDADRILAAALEHAEPPYAARITTLLLARENESAWGGLIANHARLTPETRQQLRARPELLRMGIADALRNNGPRGMSSALAFLTEHPCPQVCDLVADALREPSPRVREAAARVLRSAAERLLADTLPVGQSASRACPPAAERAALVAALRSALRTFELHLRLDVLEACLWFAKNLGESLWDALGARRSRSAYAVTQHLQAWNDPRLAGFLLLALGRPPWRGAARKLLSSWQTRGELLAILENSDLLADPAVRRGLRLLRRPRWLAAADPALADLPPAARAWIPYWLCHLGFTDDERLCCLDRWRASPWPELRRAATYALATLETSEAASVLADVAKGGDPVARFARWFVAGWFAKEEHSPPTARSAPGTTKGAQTEVTA